MDFENLFAELEKITERKSNKILCCNIIENHKNVNGVIECLKCSKIISNILSTPEWRYYGADDTKSGDPTRCGMPMNALLPDSSVGSIILNQYSKDKNMNQIKKYQDWSSMTYKERSTYKVYNVITDICKKCDLPKVIEIEAKSLYKIISETKISRGNNRKGIIASCIYFACKTCNVPRSQKEIAQIFDLKIPVMTKGCKLFQEIIHMSKNKNRVLNADSISSEDFIERFCNRLNIDEFHIKKIKKIEIDSRSTYIISEVRPDSIAAGSILLYSKLNNLNIDKSKISEISRISEVTINKCCKKLQDFMYT
jgi:transcription initiation factor TFIIB